MKRFRFELVDDYDEDTMEEGDTDMLNDDERAAWADEQPIVANEQDIPFYNQPEMERIGAYHVKQILRGQYRQGWHFLTKWEGYGTSESTWEPVRAFLLMMESSIMFSWITVWHTHLALTKRYVRLGRSAAP